MNKQINTRKKAEKRKNRKKWKKNKIINKFIYFIQIIIPIIISVISMIISVISVRITMKENRKNDLILKPRFSLEKDTKTDKDNLFIWKIKNLGGEINNATINPIVQVTFSVYNDNKEVALDIHNYYSDYKYNDSDSSFYVNDDKKDELESLFSL